MAYHDSQGTEALIFDPATGELLGDREGAGGTADVAAGIVPKDAIGALVATAKGDAGPFKAKVLARGATDTSYDAADLTVLEGAAALCPPHGVEIVMKSGMALACTPFARRCTNPRDTSPPMLCATTANCLNP